MAATPGSPVYTVYAISDGTKYHLNPVLKSLRRTEAAGQIAQKVVLELSNVLVGSVHLSTILKARDRIYVYADDGTKSEEVFRGYLWERTYTSTGSERNLKITAYDCMIYFQESEESEYFSAGYSTEFIMSLLCKFHSIEMVYSYSSITHEKMPLRGTLYDIIIEDLLEPVRKRTGKKYTVISDRDVLYIKTAGSNTTVYQFIAGKNVSGATSGWTMDGIVTRVAIVSKPDKNGKVPLEAYVNGDTKKYGTLQKIQQMNEDTSLEDAKKEAQNTIDENGEPKWEYEITAPDVPWIRKGDLVYVDAGDIDKKYLIVTEVERLSSKKERKMTLTMEAQKKGGDSSE